MMTHRYRVELKKHDGTEIEKQARKFGIWPPMKPCHCKRGIGFLRKRKPFDCGKPGCLACHAEKVLEPRRAREKRRWTKEIRLELVCG